MIIGKAKEMKKPPVKKAPKAVVAGSFLAVLAVGIATIANGIKLDREAEEKAKKAEEEKEKTE